MTSVGAHGLPTETDENYIVRDDPLDFAGEISALLSNPQKRMTLKQNALVFSRTHLSRTAIYKDLDDVLRK